VRRDVGRSSIGSTPGVSADGGRRPWWWRVRRPSSSTAGWSPVRSSATKATHGGDGVICCDSRRGRC